MMSSSQKRSEYRSLFRHNVKGRLIVDKVVMGVILGCVIVAIIPLGSILLEVFKNGLPALSVEFLTQTPGAIGTSEGGIGPAIQGTLIIIGMSSLIGIPVGVMAGSIVLGIFAFLSIVLLLGHFTLWAGAFALSLIMFPIVARTTEESLKLVPLTYREAGLALGLRQWIVTFRIVLSAAKNGMITGILLAVARISGETAPLIMTVLGSSQFFAGFDSPMDALPLRVWRLSLLPYDSARLQGWGAAVVLIIIILAINIGVRYYFAAKSSSKGKLFYRIMGGKKQ
ncbi:MAG: ABC transporter permease subunit [Thaumarchaeota archaeon]|nr:ABC transporter permease subunit [Nitrososphaerota archaeon]